MNKKNSANLSDEIKRSQPFESIQEEVFLNLIRTHDHLVGQFNQLVKQYGLSGSQYNVLRILKGYGKPMPVYNIAERMISQQPDITRLIDRMERIGLVSRERSKDDRRVVWVMLTEIGESVLKKLEQPINNLHHEQLSHLNSKKLERLNQLLFETRHKS